MILAFILTVVSLLSTSLYLGVAGAVWERRRPRSTDNALEYHKAFCGYGYPNLHHCRRHSRGDEKCDACWAVDYGECIYRKCDRRRETDHRSGIYSQLWPSLFWPLFLPLWVGAHFARRPPAPKPIDAEALAALERQVLES